MSLLPKDLENMLGTKEEFEASKKVDEDGDDLVGEKINQEYQDNMRDDLFEEMATDALIDMGLTEDEAERMLEDFNN